MFELRSAVLTSMEFKRKVLRDVHISHIYKPKSAIAVNSHWLWVQQIIRNESKWNETKHLNICMSTTTKACSVSYNAQWAYMAQSKRCFKKNIVFPRLILCLFAALSGQAQYHLFALSCASYYMMLILFVGWTIVVVYQPDLADTITKIHPKKKNETHKNHTAFPFVMFAAVYSWIR